LQQRISILKSLFSKIARPVVALSAVLTLSAASLLLGGCGAGVSEVANLATNTTVTAVVSPARVVAGQIYTYQATAPNGVSVTWNWGDGSPDSVGTTVQKVWNKFGNQTVTLSATASGKTTAVTQTVAVSSEPVSAGGSHTCALQASGTVLCWGGNDAGQLGDGTTVTRTVTAAVTGLTDAVAVSAGNSHTCALKAGGSVVCWGSNNTGELGDGTFIDKTTPVAVTGLTDATALRAGLAHTCAIKANASVVCWGRNLGQLGDGSTEGDRTTPVAVIGLTDAVAISPGFSHTCALKANGTVVCWGLNSRGELGNGTTINSTATVAVTGLQDAVALGVMSQTTCALKASGSVVCWGNNTSGQLGSTGVNPSTTTRVVTGLTDAVALSGSPDPDTGGHVCAIKANRSPVCWGDNSFGEIGNGASGLRSSGTPTPTAVIGLTDTSHLCAQNQWCYCLLGY
jgi:alpha-tubulin suppressor-like RCC1 family protein